MNNTPLPPLPDSALKLRLRFPNALVSGFEGAWPSLAQGVYLADGVVLNGDITIGRGSNLWYGVVLRGDVNYIKVGEDVNIQDGTVVHVATNGPPTLIGNRVSIGHMALIHACQLGDDSFIGMKALVMDGAVVEAGAFVAAGAMVPPGKTAPAGWLWAGSPGKPIRPLTDKDRQLMQWTWPHYVKLAARQAASGSGTLS